jgi:hypothetical protein
MQFFVHKNSPQLVVTIGFNFPKKDDLKMTREDLPFPLIRYTFCRDA